MLWTDMPMFNVLHLNSQNNLHKNNGQQKLLNNMLWRTMEDKAVKRFGLVEIQV